jgi:hypothetical protein
MWFVTLEEGGVPTDSVFAAPEPKPKKNRELKTEILPVGVPTGGNTPANMISPAASLPTVGTTLAGTLSVGTPAVGTPAVGTPAVGTPTIETPTG